MLKKIFTALWKSLAARVCVSIYKAVISVLVIVCLFFCLSDDNSGTPGPICSFFDWGNRESQGNVLSLVLIF